MMWIYIDTIKKKIETLIDASKEAVLGLNVEKTKCMLISHHQNVNWDIKQLIVWKCVTVQIFGDDSNKSKFDSGEN
jgi:hypothetical protein